MRHRCARAPGARREHRRVTQRRIGAHGASAACAASVALRQLAQGPAPATGALATGESAQPGFELATARAGVAEHGGEREGGSGGGRDQQDGQRDSGIGSGLLTSTDRRRLPETGLRSRWRPVHTGRRRAAPGSRRGARMRRQRRARHRRRAVRWRTSARRSCRRAARRAGRWPGCRPALRTGARAGSRRGTSSSRSARRRLHAHAEHEIGPPSASRRLQAHALMRAFSAAPARVAQRSDQQDAGELQHDDHQQRRQVDATDQRQHRAAPDAAPARSAGTAGHRADCADRALNQLISAWMITAHRNTSSVRPSSSTSPSSSSPSGLEAAPDHRQDQAPFEDREQQHQQHAGHVEPVQARHVAGAAAAAAGW